MQLWDSKVRSLYSAASSLVNDRVETLRGYGRIQTALDVCLQSIVRRAGPFYKPPSSTSTSKPGEDRGSSCAVASAYKVEQKRRSRGKGRLIKGLSSHPTPRPVSEPPKNPATSVSVAREVVFPGRDIRSQYRDTLQGGSHQSGSGDCSRSPSRVKPRADPSSTPVKGDLRAHLTSKERQ